MRDHRSREECAAFTLIELLVSVAIMALLTGILLPALMGAREQGKAAMCLARMRTLGQLTAEYAASHKDEMPRSRHSAGFSLDSWGFVFHEMLTNEAFESRDQRWLNTLNTHFRCPSDDRHVGPDDRIDAFSYGYNVYYELRPDEIGGAANANWRKSLFAPRPSDAVLFGELRSQSVADHAMAHFWRRYAAPPEIESHRHNHRCNCVFLDGHATTIAFEETFDPARQVDRWNPGGWDGDIR